MNSIGNKQYFMTNETIFFFSISIYMQIFNMFEKQPNQVTREN